MVKLAESSHDDKPESELPLNPTVTQEEEEEGATKKDTADSTLLSKPPPPKKRRRSLRNTNVSNGSAGRLDSPGQSTIHIHIIFIPTQLILYALSFFFQRIVLSDRGSLQYRRLNEFFFQEDREGSTSENNETIQIGSLTLQRVHASPNVYIIDNFLSASELGKRLFCSISAL
jgi:hypothetical protein